MQTYFIQMSNMIEGDYCYVDFYTAVERRQVFLKQLSL